VGRSPLAIGALLVRPGRAHPASGNRTENLTFLSETNSFVIEVFWNVPRFQYFVLRAIGLQLKSAETRRQLRPTVTRMMPD